MKPGKSRPPVTPPAPYLNKKGAQATLRGLLAALAGRTLMIDGTPKVLLKTEEENIRKCILPECNSVVRGNRPACCADHFKEFRRRERFARGVK